ncbi:MAG TPA: hypothetical protein VJK52_00625, partial [Candidatus Nanoarchaeia archaeon]|nr:hypothetical protein [Candidatus Nanoarchaeia archaeon]
EKGFGKRPDMLQYPNDVLDFAKQGATSFHCSEERWQNPLAIDTKSSRREQEELRIGWDLVLDIDCPLLEYSQIAADTIIRSLKSSGISAVTVKFSGNHGFHIGVPFEAFPELVPVQGQPQETRLSFPEGPRKIAAFLQERIRGKLGEAMLAHDDINIIGAKTGKAFSELVVNNSFDPFKVLAIDTVLIAARHLYRMPYCFNEKSGLVSLPLKTNAVLDFEKSQAIFDKVQVDEHLAFLDRRASTGEARNLIIQAFDFAAKNESALVEKFGTVMRDYEELKSAIPRELFPPCIQLGLKGMEDGKKRFLFVLVNFLVSVGWSYESIEQLLDEWNKKNKDPLRETILKGHVRYHQQQKKKILPPNCKEYYEGLNICKPDNLCTKIKNPVSYAKRKVWAMQQNSGKRKAGAEQRSVPKATIPSVEPNPTNQEAL